MVDRRSRRSLLLLRRRGLHQGIVGHVYRWATRLFAALPPAMASDGERAGASFYAWNMVRRYGANWTAPWTDLAIRRMLAWGFNTVGNWSDIRVANARRVPYTLTLSVRANSGPMGVADVYSPDFEAAIEHAAAQAETRKDDPYLLGYFLGTSCPGRAGKRSCRRDSGRPRQPAAARVEEIPRRRRHPGAPSRVPVSVLPEVRGHQRRRLPQARSQPHDHRPAFRRRSGAPTWSALPGPSTFTASTTTPIPSTSGDREGSAP